MITLSKRLQCVADLVPKCRVLADVGTDHAYLPVRLLQEKRAELVLASDVRKGPLQRAKENAESFDLMDQIEIILADGLDYPGAERAEVITICGMGGETMVSILEAAPWTAEGRRLILQPQSKLPELEAWLWENGYAIQDARLCMDAGKLYLALSIFGGAPWEGSSEFWLLKRRDPLMREYVRREMEKARRTLSGLRAAASCRSAEIAAAEQRMTTLQTYEKEMTEWQS